MKLKQPIPYKIPLILLSILLAVTIGVLIAIWAAFGTGGGVSKYEATSYAMGTYVTQTVYGGSSTEQSGAAAAGKSAVSDLDALISWREEGSDIQRLNNSAGSGAVDVSAETAEILETALSVAKATDGAYDPTILPISLLWNFDEDAKTVPADDVLQTYLPYVDYTQLTVDRDACSAALAGEHSAVDLGAIGKGAACDAVTAAYAETGISGGIVAVGGSVGVYGEKGDGTSWTIGLRNPNSGDDTAASMGTLSIAGGFVSTSGTYEKTFTADGVTYHHILDPNTGYPANTGLVSATVYCGGSGALSDALSTACILLGQEDAIALLESYGAGGVFITTENEVIVTGSLRDSFTLTDSSFTLQS